MKPPYSTEFSRRQFLALATAGIALPGVAPSPGTAGTVVDHSLRVMVSGGTITSPAGFIPAMQAAQKAFFGDRKKILLILHASLPDDRDRMEKKLKSFYSADGFEAESLHHYNGSAAIDKINEAEAIFVSGGETFLLLSTLQHTDQLSVLRRRILEGVPYHGTSAGSNIAGPCIGCTNDFPITEVSDLKGLNIFPAVINPHHPLTTEPDYAGRVHKVQGYLRYNTTQIVLGLANGSAAVLEGNAVRIAHGPAFLYKDATVTPLSEGPVSQLTGLG